MSITAPPTLPAARTAAREVRNLTAGAWTSPSGGDTEPVYDPATGELLAHTPMSGAAEVDAVVRGAELAFPAWAATPVVERARIMFAFRALLEEHFDELAALVTLENGKDARDAAGEVRRGIEVVEFACGMPTLMMGETVRDVARGVDNASYRFPVGVVAAITPFNFPCMVPLWTLPIAIAAGNSYVLKPSERTPLCAQRLGELLAEAGLPPGVFSIVHGGRAAVDALCEHPGVRAVSFVGSRTVGAHVYRHAAAHGKRVQALTGAKNSLIVLPDADLDRTVEAIVSSAYGNAGERCLAGSVLIAVGEIADPLLHALTQRLAGLRIGPGSDPASELTPLIRATHRASVTDAIDQAEREGATVLVDGRTPPREDGFFLGATLLDHVCADMAVAREEIFGPVLATLRVASLDQAIKFTNASAYGNACCLFTDSGAAVRRFRERIQAGMLGINVGVPGPMAFFPFNGLKDSFFGDLHATGKDGVRFFTDNKVEVTRWFSPAGDASA